MARWKYFLSCEHGGNHIPTAYQPLFKGAEEVLASHRGWDPGALELFHALQQQAIDFALYSETSRLLVELNRSLHRRSLFSVYTRDLPPQEKLALLDRFYHPFRDCFFSAAYAGIELEMNNRYAGNKEVAEVLVQSYHQVVAQLGSDW